MSVLSVCYLDMSPQYHSASCSEPPAPPSLAPLLLPPPTPTEEGCWGFAGFGGRAAEGEKERKCYYWKRVGRYTLCNLTLVCLCFLLQSSTIHPWLHKLKLSRYFITLTFRNVASYDHIRKQLHQKELENFSIQSQTCTHTSYANYNTGVFISPHKRSSGAVGDRIVINHTGKRWHDKHSPYIISNYSACHKPHTLHTHI